MLMPPVPTFTRSELPVPVAAMDPQATAVELADATSARAPYDLPELGKAYMVDIVRAFRPLTGATTYVEVGSRDKGNLAWLQRRFGPSPLIIDVDLEHLPAAKERFERDLRSDATYAAIQGDSADTNTVLAVQEQLAGRLVDAIFLDSSHMYNHILREIDLYLPLVRPGGLLLIHDAFWEGNDRDKGKSQALQVVNQYLPVYAVFMNEPVRRHFPLSTKGDTWGGVGVIIRQ